MATNYVSKMKKASWNETSMKETILVVKTNKVGLCLRKAAALEHLVCQSILWDVDYIRQKKVTQEIILILSTKNYMVDFKICCLKSQEEEWKNI